MAFRTWPLRPNGFQNGVKMGPKRLPGGFLKHVGLLEASWSGLGGLLERALMVPGPNKSDPERLLAGLRGIPREVSAILEAKWLPNRMPRGSQMELNKHFDLKMPRDTTFVGP